MNILRLRKYSLSLFFTRRVTMPIKPNVNIANVDGAVASTLLVSVTLCIAQLSQRLPL
jgi:hypothetical protein